MLYQITLKWDMIFLFMEVKDEEEEALLHIQAHGQACAQQLDMVPLPDSPRQSPNA